MLYQSNPTPSQIKAQELHRARVERLFGPAPRRALVRRPAPIPAPVAEPETVESCSPVAPAPAEPWFRIVDEIDLPAAPRPRIAPIIRVVAKHYRVDSTDILSSRRTANVVRPRQMAMYLAKTLTLRSLPEIGRRFGGRDHTTVLHAVRKIEALVAKDVALSDEVDLLKRQIAGGGAR